MTYPANGGNNPDETCFNLVNSAPRQGLFIQSAGVPVI
jgi:hypothetical protein